MSKKRIKKPIRRKKKSDYPGEMSFRKALGNNPIYYQEDNSTIPKTIRYGNYGQSTISFNPELFQPNPLTGRYNWEKPQAKPQLRDFEPKQKAAERSSTNVATKQDPIKAARQINAAAAEEYERNRGVIRNAPVPASSYFKPGGYDPMPFAELTGVPSIMRIAQNPEGVKDFLTGVDQLVLGSSPVSGMMDMRREFTPEEIQAMSDYGTVAAMAAPLAKGAVNLGAQGLRQAGRYATTQTPLKNVYKYNPWAFKPNPKAYYRMIGKEGFNDAVQSGVIRPPQTSRIFDQGSQKYIEIPIPAYEEAYYNAQFPLDKRWYPQNKVRINPKTGKPMLTSNGYEGPYMAEVTGNSHLFENAENVAAYTGPNASQTVTYSKEFIPTNTPGVKFYKEDWLRGYKPVEVPKQLPGSPNAISSVDFSNYPSQLEAVQARSQRMLSQKHKKGWNEQLTPDLENKFSTAVEKHNVSDPNISNVELGKNYHGRTGTGVAEDPFSTRTGLPLTESQKSMIAAHEAGHYYANSSKEGKSWAKYFDFSEFGNSRAYMRGKHNYNNFYNEIRERAAQLKDYIAFKNNIPLNKDFKITRSQLDDALENYVKNTGLDNGMTVYIKALKKKGNISGFLKEMNKRPLGLAPIMGAGAAGTYGANQLINQEPQMKRQGGKLYYQQDVGQLPGFTNNHFNLSDYLNLKTQKLFMPYTPTSQKKGGVDSYNTLINNFKQGVRNQENGIRAGWNETEKKWYPHKSVEGGSPTIAYGHKLKTGDSFPKGLSEKEALELFEKDFIEHEKIAKKIINEKYGKDVFSTLPKSKQLLFTDYAFNGVLKKFPSFTDALINDDYDGMIKEYMRYSNNAPLKARNKWTKEYIDSNFSPKKVQKGLVINKQKFARGGSLTSAQNTAQAADLNRDVMRKDIKKASVGEDFMAGLYGVGEGLLDTLSFGLTDELTDAGFKGLQAAAGHDINSEEAKRQAGIKGWGNIGGAVTGAIINPGAMGSAIEEGMEGLGQGVKGIDPNSPTATGIGTALEGMGSTKAFTGLNNKDKIPEGMEGFSKIFMARNGGRFRYGYQGGGHMLNQNMGLTEIDGPSHEEGGVTLPNNGGRPDVEVEGPETIYTPENYVMSEKMKASLEALEFAGITGKSAKRLAGKSYADLSKMIKAKAGDKLRPNDPLSKKMLDKEMKKLMQAHEYDREAKRMRDEAMRTQMMGGSNIIAETPEERAGGYNMYPNAQSIAFPGSGPTSVVPTYNNDPIMVTGADGSQQMLTDEPIETQAPFIEEKMAQGGKMIKRADGSYSRTGLWDNIRANRGSGKKPTKQMLEQEVKIKAAEKAYGGYYALGGYMGDYITDDDTMEYGEGGYTVRRSNDRKGKTHVVTGPDGTKKYFGDPKLGERGKSKYGKDAFYARHKKNLAKNPYFRAYARATWEDGGYMDMLDSNVDMVDMEAPMYAYGGPMMYAQGGIHIDPSKRGTFKAQASKMGMGVQEAARSILNAPEGKYSPAMRKKANFARNFAKEYGGYYQMGGEMMQPEQAPQQGGEEQILQQVAQMLQQGMSPEDIVGQLVQMGLPQEQAIQIVEMVVQQMQGQQQAQQQAPQQAPPMMRNGGYMYQMGGEMIPQEAPQQQAQGGEEQIVQAIMQMLQQGMQPEEIVAQLVQMGLPQEAAIQAVQMVMQQSQQGQQQPQPPFEQGMMGSSQPPMRYGGRYNPLIRKNGGKLYYQQENGPLPNTTGTLQNILDDETVQSGIYKGADAIAIGNQANTNAASLNKVRAGLLPIPTTTSKPSLPSLMNNEVELTGQAPYMSSQLTTSPKPVGVYSYTPSSNLPDNSITQTALKNFYMPKMSTVEIKQQPIAPIKRTLNLPTPQIPNTPTLSGPLNFEKYTPWKPDYAPIVGGGLAASAAPLANIITSFTAEDTRAAAPVKFERPGYEPVALARQAGNQALGTYRSALRAASPTAGAYLSNLAVTAPSMGVNVGKQVAEQRANIDARRAQIQGQEQMYNDRTRQFNILNQARDEASRNQLRMQGAAGLGEIGQGIITDVSKTRGQEEMLRALETKDFSPFKFERDARGRWRQVLSPRGAEYYMNSKGTNQVVTDSEGNKYEVLPNGSIRKMQ